MNAIPVTCAAEDTAPCGPIFGSLPHTITSIHFLKITTVATMSEIEFWKDSNSRNQSGRVCRVENTVVQHAPRMTTFAAFHAPIPKGPPRTQIAMIIDVSKQVAHLQINFDQGIQDFDCNPCH
jgi:hypothetical protein